MTTTDITTMEPVAIKSGVRVVLIMPEGTSYESDGPARRADLTPAQATRLIADLTSAVTRIEDEFGEESGTSNYVDDLTEVTQEFVGCRPFVFLGVNQADSAENGNMYQVGPFRPCEARELALNLMVAATAVESATR